MQQTKEKEHHAAENHADTNNCTEEQYNVTGMSCAAYTCRKSGVCTAWSRTMQRQPFDRIHGGDR